MLNRIIQQALKNRLTVLVFAIVLIVAGVLTTARMDVDVFPELTAPTITVLTEAGNLSPEDVEKQVTFPIEAALNGAENVRRIRSSSTMGFSVVWVEFDWSVELHMARQVVSEKLNLLQSLPNGAKRPVIAPPSSVMGEVMFIGVTSQQDDLMKVRSMADWVIRPRLLAVPGVAQVFVLGGEYKQYQILASPEKMRNYHVTLNELIQSAKESSGNAAGGIINEYGSQYIIKGVGQPAKVSEIGGSLIKIVNGLPVTINDVAEVKIGAAPKIGEGAVSGKPAVIITVLKQNGINTIELTKKIDAAVGDIQKTIPAGIEVNTKIFRQADFIQASINNISKTIWEGSVVVIIIIYLFLANWRPTIISVIAIPLSLITAVLVLKWQGLTLNTMSLGGMAIAIGDLVDDAIIDVENVYKRLKQNAALPLSERRSRLSVIYDASVEVRSSVISATAIIIVAFIPLFFLTGIEGKLLRPLGIAFIVSLFSSLLIAITLTPVLCSYLFTESKLKVEQKESWLVRFLKTRYEWLLIKALEKKRLVLAAGIVMFVVSVFLFRGFGRSFLPEFNEGSLVVTATTDAGISLEESSRIGRAAEKKLLSLPEVQLTSRRTGRAELDEHTQGSNTSEIDAPYILTNRSKAEFYAAVRKQLSEIPGVHFSVGQPISHRIDHILSGVRSNVAIKVFGPNLATLQGIAQQVGQVINAVPGVVDVNVEQQSGVPHLRIVPRRDMLAMNGITVGDFVKFINAAYGGERVAELYEEEKRYDLVVRYNDFNRSSIQHVGNSLIDKKEGGKIPLRYVADVVSASNAGTINRENVQRKTVVSANIQGGDHRSVIKEIREQINRKVVLPEGYRIEYGGQFEAEAKASKKLFIASLLSILVIFLLLYNEFKSSKTAVIILLNLPMALIGGIISIYLTSKVISIPAIIGFVTLFGIATRNGILLMSNYKTLQQQGIPLTERIIKGSVDRLSPILMTGLTAGLALIPLAISGDLPGNEIQSPMAKVILGGLFTSTLLNLFIVPIVYSLKGKNLPG